MRPEDSIPYVLHNSYLRPLLDKHSKNESITYEDLIHSWDQVVHQREKILNSSSEFVAGQNNQDNKGSMMELDNVHSSTSTDANQNDKKEELKDKDRGVVRTITITRTMKEIEQMHQNLLTGYNNAAQQYYENILHTINLPPPNPPSEKQNDYLSRCINQIQNDLQHDKNLYHGYSWRVDNSMKDEWLWIPIKRKISEYYGEKFNQKLELLKERKAAAAAAVVAAASNAATATNTTSISDNIHSSDMEQPKTESNTNGKPITTVDTTNATNNSLGTENVDTNNIAQNVTSIPSSTDTVLPTGSTNSLPSTSSNPQPQKASNTANTNKTNTVEEGTKVDAITATATAAITTNTNNEATCDPLDSEKHLTEDEDAEEFYEDDEYSDDGEIDEINEEEEELQQELSDGEEVDESNVAAAGSSQSSGNPTLEHGDAKPKTKIMKRTTAATTTTTTPHHERTVSDPSLQTPRRAKLNTTQSQQSSTGSRSTTNKRKVRESVGSSSTVGERGGGGRSSSGKKAARTGRGRGRGGRGGRSRGTN